MNVEYKANVVAVSRAMDFGRISPKKRRAVDVMTVMTNPLKACSKTTAMMDEAATTAMLLPTSVVLRKRSGYSRNRYACWVPLTPCRIQTSIFIRRTEIMAVSEPEKNAEKNKAMTNSIRSIVACLL